MGGPLLNIIESQIRNSIPTRNPEKFKTENFIENLLPILAIFLSVHQKHLYQYMKVMDCWKYREHASFLTIETFPNEYFLSCTFH